MKNRVEHIHETSSDLNFTMDKIKAKINAVSEKYNADGYKIISTESVKNFKHDKYDIRIIIFFEKI